MKKPFFAFEQTSGNSRWLSVTHEASTPLRPEPETANADNELYPGFRLHPGRSLDSWFFRQQPAGHRRLLLQRLTGHPVNDDRPCRELIAIPTKNQKKNVTMIRTSSLAAILLAVVFGSSA